jgi:hypothetical protein
MKKKTLNIELHELYNFLKYVRHKIDISSLSLNRENKIDILSNIYKNSYLNKFWCPCIFSLGEIKIILFILFFTLFVFFQKNISIIFNWNQMRNDSRIISQTTFDWKKAFIHLYIEILKQTIQKNTYFSSVDVLTLYVPFLISILANIRSLFNFLTFQSKVLRRNSCGSYFIIWSIRDIFLINFSLITKFSNDHLRINLYNTWHIFCQILIFLTQTFPCISTVYLVLAAFDRCLSTSDQTYYRLFSQIKFAYRLTIILNSSTNSHLFFNVDLRPKYVAQFGGYSIFILVDSIVWTSLITCRNIRWSCQRLSRGNEEQRSRTNIHLIKMTLFQVISSSIFDFKDR